VWVERLLHHKSAVVFGGVLDSRTERDGLLSVCVGPSNSGEAVSAGAEGVRSDMADAGAAREEAKGRHGLMLNIVVMKVLWQDDDVVEVPLKRVRVEYSSGEF
jgi:hypothetical protein